MVSEPWTEVHSHLVVLRLVQFFELLLHVRIDCFVHTDPGMEASAVEVAAAVGFFVDVGPQVQGTGAVFEYVVAGQS